MTALSTDLIDIRVDARAVDETAVAGLAESIADVGLINPIRVRASGDRWEVIAGVHRLMATRQLGLAEIECHVVNDDDLHAELAMIDENLIRHELSMAERASSLSRRRDIYNELRNPLVGRGGDRRSDQVSSGQLIDPTFAEQTATATGMSERMVYKHLNRGDNIIPEVLEMITGTELDNGAFLDKIKNAPPNDQYRMAERELALIRSRERDKKRQVKASKIDADVKARAAKEAAEILAEYVPGEWWDNLKSNLYAAGAKHVADALTNITGQSIMDHAA